MADPAACPEQLTPIIDAWYAEYLGYLERLGVSSEMDEVAGNTRALLGDALWDDGIMRALAISATTNAQAFATGDVSQDEYDASDALLAHTAVMVLQARAMSLPRP